jgi:hypothetical protein
LGTTGRIKTPQNPGIIHALGSDVSAVLTLTAFWLVIKRKGSSGDHEPDEPQQLITR